tara:strand:+ start:810 stop:953 length:144 start_codon:yes stop_codon:yes gene_type:complete
MVRWMDGGRMTSVSVDGNAGGGALIVTITFEDGSTYAGVVEPVEGWE